MAKKLMGHYDTLTGAERFALVIEAMARGDRAEERRLDDACPLVHYRAEDEQYRGRMRRLGVLALATALDLRGRLTVLRMVSSFGTHGHGLCDPTFGRLMQAAYLAGRERGRWEAGAADETAAPGDDPDLREDLDEVTACAALGTDAVAAAIKEAAGEIHAVEVLTRWEVFHRFCQITVGMDGAAVMRAWGFSDGDPGAEARVAYPGARPDEAWAAAEADALARGWAERFGGGP